MLRRFLLTLTVGCALLRTVMADDSTPAPAKRYLIIHADDAGMSHSVNRATSEALEGGIVSSCSIMIPCPWVTEFAEYAQQHPEYDYGLHLTLNSEWETYRWGPVAPKDQVPSLVDENGYLWDNVPQVAANATAHDVETELRAQIERAKQLKIPVSHLDTHMGALVCRADIIEVYVMLRIWSTICRCCSSVRMDERRFAGQYPAIERSARRCWRPSISRNCRSSTDWPNSTAATRPKSAAKAMSKTIKNLPPGVSQLIIHCGVCRRRTAGDHQQRPAPRRGPTDLHRPGRQAIAGRRRGRTVDVEAIPRDGRGKEGKETGSELITECGGRRLDLADSPNPCRRVSQ